MADAYNISVFAVKRGRRILPRQLRPFREQVFDRVKVFDGFWNLRTIREKQVFSFEVGPSNIDQVHRRADGAYSAATTSNHCILPLAVLLLRCRACVLYQHVL